MEISIGELEILKTKFFLELNLKIQAPGKNVQAPWRPGDLYWSTPVYIYTASKFSGKEIKLPD
jgi:hypothetical protein